MQCKAQFSSLRTEHGSCSNIHQFQLTVIRAQEPSLAASTGSSSVARRRPFFIWRGHLRLAGRLCDCAWRRLCGSFSCMATFGTSDKEMARQTKRFMIMQAAVHWISRAWYTGIHIPALLHTRATIENSWSRDFVGGSKTTPSFHHERPAGKHRGNNQHNAIRRHDVNVTKKIALARGRDFQMGLKEMIKNLPAGEAVQRIVGAVAAINVTIKLWQEINYASNSELLTPEW